MGMKVWCSRCGTYTLPHDRVEAAVMCFNSGCQPKCMNKVGGEPCRIPLERYASQGNPAHPIGEEPAEEPALQETQPEASSTQPVPFRDFDPFEGDGKLSDRSARLSSPPGSLPVRLRG